MQLTGQGRAEEQSNFHKDIRRQLPVEWLVFGFPVTSLCLAFLNYKAERAITKLRSFLSALEKLDEAHQRLPSYNTDPRWSYRPLED